MMVLMQREDMPTTYVRYPEIQHIRFFGGTHADAERSVAAPHGRATLQSPLLFQRGSGIIGPFRGVVMHAGLKLQ